MIQSLYRRSPEKSSDNLLQTSTARRSTKSRQPRRTEPHPSARGPLQSSPVTTQRGDRGPRGTSDRVRKSAGLLVAATGLLNIVSATAPPVADRIHWIEEVLPFTV